MQKSAKLCSTQFNYNNMQMLEVHTDEQCLCTCLKCPIKLFLFQSHASNQMYTVQDTLVGVYMYFEQILANQLWVPTQNNS